MNTNNSFNAIQVVNDLRSVRRFLSSRDPEGLPRISFARLQRLRFRDIVAALTSLDMDDQEYKTLLDFAMTTLNARETQRVLSRTGGEFMFLRNHCGASQQWTADRLGVSLSTVRRWEDSDQPYSPSQEAWKWLDGLNAYVERTARRAISDGEWHDVLELVKQLGDMTESNTDSPSAGFGFDGIDTSITVRYFRDQESYESMVDRFYPRNGEPEGGVAALEAGCAYTVFPDAGYFGVQNAITQRVVELIRDAGVAHGWPARLISIKVI